MRYEVSGRSDLIDHVIVAIPARDEEDLIASCIASVDRAAGLARARHAVSVLLVVAADGCTDRTSAVARSVDLSGAVQLEVISGQWRGAGAARSAAVAHGLESVTGDMARVWIANTDADCEVPENWLDAQLELARTYRAVAGIVDINPCTATDELIALFRATYAVDGQHHGHVHGANLGLRADVYAAVGGWCPLTTVGEDHGLWGRVKNAGHLVIQASAVGVMTSGRTTSRVTGGFASELAKHCAAVVGSHASRDVAARVPA